MSYFMRFLTLGQEIELHRCRLVSQEEKIMKALGAIFGLELSPDEKEYDPGFMSLAGCQVRYKSRA